MKFDGMPLEVSLRDDPSIRSICKEFAGRQLCLSSGGFENFGTEAQNFIEKEDASVHREQRLEKQGIRELVNKAKWAVFGFAKWTSCLWAVFLVFLVVCLLVPLNQGEDVDIEAPWIHEFLMEFLFYSPCLCGVLVFVCLDDSDVCHPRLRVGCRFVVVFCVAVVGLLHRPLLFQEN